MTLGQSHILLRRLAWIIILLTIATGGDAGAQVDLASPPPRADQPPTPIATFGWSGRIPDSRWGPVNIDIINVSKPIGGHILLEFPQDDTQFAHIRIPFAATPEAPARVQAVAAIPSSALSIRLSLVDERGRTLRTVTYGAASLLALPDFTEPDAQSLIVSVGRVGASDAMVQWARALHGVRFSAVSPAGDEAAPGAWGNFHAARCEVADMPLSWMAYDAVSVLVVHADVASEADPRAVQAVREWVGAGGRLVILASTPGDHWASWLPAGVAPPVRMDSLSAAPLPDAIAAARAAFEQQVRTRVETFGDVGGRTDPLPPAAESAPARRIWLTPAGERSAWRTDWILQEQGSPALLAEGPADLGWITILGLDPARSSTVVSPRAAGIAWHDALKRINEDMGRAPPGDTRLRWQYAAPPVQAAISNAINMVGNIPVIGDAMFALIAGCIVLLALMVGPVDWFVLRRMRLSHRSWLTALAWTALAAIGAFVLPLSIRTDPAQFNRVAILDALATEAASIPGFRAVGAAHYAAVSGIYTAQSGTAQFSGVQATSWWRGVSQFQPWRSQGPGGSGVLPVLQAAAGGEAGSSRGSPVSAVPFPLWTFRTMLDQGVQPLPLGVQLRRSDGPPRVVISGLPEGVVITSAVLRMPDGWRPLRHDPAGAASGATPPPDGAGQHLPAVGTHDPGMWAGVFSGRRLSEPPADWMFSSSISQEAATGELQQLPGALARTATINRYVGSGRWACIYLNAENWPLRPSISWHARYRSGAVLRVLIPIDADPETPAEESEDRP
jgi:hypothetical protein